MVVLLNRGARTWHLKDGKDAEGKPVKRSLPPGGSIEALDHEEAQQMLGYNREIVDAEKSIPAISDKNQKIKELEAQVKTLEGVIEDLKAQLDKYEPKEKEAEKPKGHDGGHKK